MYREVLPLLDNFAKDNSNNGEKQNFIDMFPKFFGFGEVTGDLILVFEDILDGENFVSSEEIDLIFRNWLVCHWEECEMQRRTLPLQGADFGHLRESSKVDQSNKI